MTWTYHFQKHGFFLHGLWRGHFNERKIYQNNILIAKHNFKKCYWASRWLRWLRICLPCRRPRFDPWVRKMHWRRGWQPTQYSCLENPMDRRVWRATVHGVAKSRTWLKNSLRLVVDLQCYVSFRLQQSKSVIHTHTHTIFQILFPFRLLQNVEWSSLCYTGGLYFTYSDMYMLIPNS